MDNHNHIAIVAGALLLAASCSPKIVERVKVVTEYRNVYQVDTTIQHDSVYIREWVKGDPVRITEYRDKYIYRYKTIRDTLMKRDSLTVESIKEVKVEQPLSLGKRAKLRLFWPLLVAVFGLAVWTFRKPLAGLFTKFLKMIF